MNFPKEKFDKIMSLNTRILVLQLYFSKHAKLGYTQDEIGDMMKNIEVESRIKQLQNELDNYIDRFSEKELKELSYIFKEMKNDNMEIKEKYLYKDEQTKQDIKEELSLDMNIEEFLDYLEKS